MGALLSLALRLWLSTQPVFVDSMGAGRAVVLVGVDAYEVPASSLPRCAREGATVRGAECVAPINADCN